MSVLSLQVLSLNKNFQPLGFVSLKNAIESVFTERAEIIEKEDNGYLSNYDVHSWLELSQIKKELQEDEIWVNSEDPVFLVPKVIRYLNYNKEKRFKVKLSRRNIILRDESTCIYCDTELSLKNIQIEHLLPKSRGGKTIWTNVGVSCKPCNERKKDRTPEEAKMVLIRKPCVPVFLPSSGLEIKDRRYLIWSDFISEAYWNEELLA